MIDTSLRNRRTRIWKEHADILTFLPPELLGTKFRALARRRRGRDLSDLWLDRRELEIEDEELAQAADYRMRVLRFTE